MNRVESAARNLLGCRFRLHGRDPTHGLDCVGVVACATGLSAPSGYAVRSGEPGKIARLMEGAGLHKVAETTAGDVMLMRVGPGQLHLGIRTATGMIHADAGLRRVVERLGEPDWEIVGRWRL
jgi:hypothetical protein